MPNQYIRVTTLAASLLVGACSTVNGPTNHATPLIENQDDILNVLDPNIKTEEQSFAKAEDLYRTGKAENALFYYIKTVQFNNKNIKALERIATINKELSHPELANKIYKEILSIDSNNVIANEHLGLYYLENGQNGLAKQHLSSVIKQSSNNWKAHNALGVIADIEHNSNEAIGHYEDAIAIEPSNPMLLNNLGYSYYLTGNLVKAKYLFTQALGYDNKYQRAIHNLALIEVINGNFTTATALFNRIMPPHDSYNNVGFICMINGQYAAAEEYLRRAIDESPVYFPKAQENMKTLMSLKKNQSSQTLEQNIANEQPLSEPEENQVLQRTTQTGAGTHEKSSNSVSKTEPKKNIASKTTGKNIVQKQVHSPTTQKPVQVAQNKNNLEKNKLLPQETPNTSSVGDKVSEPDNLIQSDNANKLIQTDKKIEPEPEKSPVNTSNSVHGETSLSATDLETNDKGANEINAASISTVKSESQNNPPETEKQTGIDNPEKNSEESGASANSVAQSFDSNTEVQPTPVDSTLNQQDGLSPHQQKNPESNNEIATTKRSQKQEPITSSNTNEVFAKQTVDEANKSIAKPILESTQPDPTQLAIQTNPVKEAPNTKLSAPSIDNRADPVE